MKRQSWIKRRRWRMFLIATYTRLVGTPRWAVRRKKSSYERSTDVSSDLDHTEHQASEWVARLIADDVSNDDLARFEAWRSSHPHHARAYEELHSTWLMLTALKDGTDDCQFTANQATA